MAQEVDPDGARDYLRVRDAIHYLVAHRLEQPGLAELARHVHMSESHLQRLFTRWAGVAPKRFLQFLTKEHAKQLLRQGTVENAALATGLSGPSRLHDLMVVCESVTPGEYKAMGRGLRVAWGLHPSPFGDCLLGVAPRGVCFLAFCDGDEEAAQAQAELQADWALAHVVQDQEGTAAWAQRIFGSLAGGVAGGAHALPQPPLSVLLKGSPFQLRVWEALLRLRSGELCSYQGLARSIGLPQGSRAVASAVAANAVAMLIPCHRVIRGTGEIHQYRWGSERKRALIAWEQAALDRAPAPGARDHMPA